MAASKSSKVTDNSKVEQNQQAGQKDFDLRVSRSPIRHNGVTIPPKSVILFTDMNALARIEGIEPPLLEMPDEKVESYDFCIGDEPEMNDLGEGL